MMRLTFCFFLSLILLSCNNPQSAKSDHFDGKRFFNPTGQSRTDKTFLDLIKWRFSDKKKQWPEWIKTKQKKVLSKRVKKGDLRVSFINHASVLIQMDGLNILTDPIWSKRASPFTFLGPKRVQLPGIKFEDLPKIDAIIISHNHYDHMDTPTIKRLTKRDKPKIIFGLGNVRHLDKLSKKNSIELDWNEKIKIGELTISFLPCQHWSKRSLIDTNKSLWGAFAIKGSHKVYFAGDTGYGKHFREAGEGFGGFDLALIPIGGYEPRWFMKGSHINPVEAYQAHKDLRSKLSIGIHYGTFQLTDEAIDAPTLALKKLVRGGSDFIFLKNGESYPSLK